MGAATEAEEVDLDGVDLTDVDWFADGPPHELFARLRSEAPVRWNRTSEGGGFWSLSKRADIAAVSRDTETFSSYRAGVFVHPDQVIPLDLARRMILFKDPPEHTKFRKILRPFFSGKAIAERKQEVRAIVTRVLDDVIEDGVCDFVQDLAVRVPLTVLIHLMGVPESDIDRFYRWTHEIERSQQAVEPAAASDTFGEMAVYLHEQVERQKEEGGDSLVMRLREAEVDGDQLSDEEILVFFGVLVFAGNDTTRNTTANGTLALLSHPEQWSALKADLELIPGAVEEILRYTSVVNYFCRTATTDTEIRGQTIAAGEKVLLWYTSASRDEDEVEDPQRFDVTRENVEHNAFGGGGNHFCLGNRLARLELRILFEELTRRMPDLEVAGPIEHLSSNWANALTAMPVRFTPGEREG